MRDKFLNPGSDEAIEQGCTCPVLDNAHGRGYLGGMRSPEGNPLFVMSADCPLHGGVTCELPTQLDDE
jgi:hypothetical protein